MASPDSQIPTPEADLGLGGKLVNNLIIQEYRITKQIVCSEASILTVE